MQPRAAGDSDRRPIGRAGGPGPGIPRHATPPRAAAIPERLERFGRVRVDNYYWLKDRTNPKVIAYLDAENAYTDALMAPTKGLPASPLRRDRRPDQAGRLDRARLR